MTNSLTTTLTALTLPKLVETFNNLSAIVDSVEITKFADKPKGVARTLKMLDRVNEYRAENDLPLIGIADDGKLFNIEPSKVEAPKPAPAAPKAASAKSKSPGRTAAVSPSDVIVVLVAGNPKFAAAAERFAKYATGIRVSDYVEALGGDRKQALRDINWDKKQNWIQVVGAKSKEAKAALAPTQTVPAEPEQLLLAAPAALLMIAGPVAQPSA